MPQKKDDPQTREQALTVLRFAWDYTMLDPAGFEKCIKLLDTEREPECGHNDTYVDATGTVVCNECGKRFDPDEWDNNEAADARPYDLLDPDEREI
jgi:hypothetical protein